MGYDFAIEYKPGCLNVVANALSKRDMIEDGLACALTGPRLAIFDELRAVAVTDPG